MLQLLYLPFLAVLLLAYFRLAVQFNIVDKPNHRSSHKELTIRGAGIIFPAALFIQASISGWEYPLFSCGLLIISLISFYDDVRPLASKVRLFAHLLAVSLLFKESGLFELPVWIACISFILVIGTINAYNFMDGINGITVGYSLVAILSLYFINENIIQFVMPDWLLVTGLGLLVFGYFNFRKSARCFAGDVGSVSMAFILIFFVLLLIVKSADLKYIGLFLLYGLDSVTTIVFRILRKENIFEAHRSHFYQYLANVKRWPHLKVSALYMLVQFLMNLVIVYYDFTFPEFFVLLLVSGSLFALMRFRVEGKEYLLEARKE